MWLFVYGPEPLGYHQVSARDLFTLDGNTIRSRQHPRAATRLQAELDKAVKAQNFERAIILRDLLKARQQPLAA
ncbi:UvrB/UvrC motif-containing protein [Microvirga massiliensis]|uniref:UvrB/UvrC motif-containing protein n=1 Tax=Microvirga massiliensis TaxID=1033741 RepID=UPI00062B42D9|nr:UvrB/UvrC motif-containing protein [Microvirga massiliensis]